MGVAVGGAAKVSALSMACSVYRVVLVDFRSVAGASLQYSLAVSVGCRSSRCVCVCVCVCVCEGRVLSHGAHGTAGCAHGEKKRSSAYTWTCLQRPM